MNGLIVNFKAKYFLFIGVVFLLNVLIGLTHALAETYYPVSSSYNDIHWGYDPEPCGSMGDGANKYDLIWVNFPDIGNDDKEVVSAKLYIKAVYNYVPDDEDDSTAVKQGLCNPYLPNKVYSVDPRYYFVTRDKYLPNNVEVEIDIPLGRFACDKENRSYSHKFIYYKTSVVNQYVQLGGARLEITFGGSCPQQPSPPPPQSQCTTIQVSGFDAQDTANGTYTRASYTKNNQPVWESNTHTIEFGGITPNLWEILLKPGLTGMAGRPALCDTGGNPGDGPFSCSDWREWWGSSWGFRPVPANFTCLD
jgi:hypothetical protein